MDIHMELERRLADVQEDRSGRRVPERLRRERRHRRRRPDQGRRRRLRRAESRQHHRRLPAEPRGDQGVPAQGRRRGAHDPAASCRPASASCSSPTASSAWTATSAPLPELCALAEEFGCIMMVDDAHASGVFGRERPRHDRSLRHARPRGHPGRHAVEGDRRARRLRRRQPRRSSSSCYHRARPFLFSTSHPPAVAAACIAALDVLMEEPEIIERLWENTRFFKAGLQRARLQHRR